MMNTPFVGLRKVIVAEYLPQPYDWCVHQSCSTSLRRFPATHPDARRQYVQYTYLIA